MCETSVIKNLYEQIFEKKPIYIFRANQFELSNINDLFTNHTLQDFIAVHKDENYKIVVIDSAEKLSDLKNTDPFKEFLKTLVEKGWKLIFTTRDNYLGDLNFQFFEIYKIAPIQIRIEELDLLELNAIAEKNSFSLPNDEKLLGLIKNPFYLSEYLRFYQPDEQIDCIGFRERLWNKIIKKSKPPREQCFLNIAFERANTGQFFVIPDCESQILDNELIGDGILGYESPFGYFITHDIYEEWALEKIIEKAYTQKTGNKDFFEKIGTSLAIRRAFRHWLSEKLLFENEEIKDFIEDVLADKSTESFWKDEALVSVLLSNYADNFFDICKSELLTAEQELLKRLTFLLRIACKEVDDDFLKQLGVRKPNIFSLKYIFTKPKGRGWKSLIRFVFEHLEKIGTKNIYFILPVIHDWSSKFKEGETTRLSSLIALKYYQWIIDQNVYFPSNNDQQDHLLQTILYGSQEIKDELGQILEEVISNKWKNHRDPYYDLSRFILTKLEALPIVQALPTYVLQLANLFWTSNPKEEDIFHQRRDELEDYFGIEHDYLQYHPSSAYKTPIYWLLQNALTETVDFVLAFINNAVECFAKSELGQREVEEVEVFIDEQQSVKQYIANRLWCMYRGTQVGTHLLESIHMALEKFFLERGKNADSKTLKDWLLHLLKNSQSASISAVVTSIVLAYPEKTFYVAKILFQTKEFFFYDTTRYSLDLSQKNSLQMLRDNFGGLSSQNEIYENERLQACDDKHRKKSLEHLALSYQIFRGEEVSEDEAETRQKLMWDIFDNYYDELNLKAKGSESENTWKLYLARMDRRKMNPETEEKDGHVLIKFNPEIEPELKEYSEQSLNRSSELMKHSSLKLWAGYKSQKDDTFKQYRQYEENPKLALKEVKEIVSKLTDSKESSEEFRFLNYSIPADVCSVLLRDHLDILSEDEKLFCKDVVLEVAFSSLKKGYEYQISDGSQSAISVLPVLFKEFPEDREKIKIVLLLTLFNDYPIDMASNRFNAFSIGAIHQLWTDYFCDAQSLLLGYLSLKPKHEEIQNRFHEENRRRGIFRNLHESEIIDKFLQEREIALRNVVENKISTVDVGDIKKLDPHILRTAFQLIPLKTTDLEHKKIVKEIVSVFVVNLLSTDRDDRLDYGVTHDFLTKLAYFVLSSEKAEIQDYLKPFLDNFKGTESIADLFKEFIYAQDRLNSYDNFWEVWSLFEDKVIGLCKDGDGFGYVDRIVKTYLFANCLWKETATEWHTLKKEDKRFFKRICEGIGHCASTLYSISKLLNDIGSSYLFEGVSWISSMLQNNKGLSDAKLENNTIYYLENLVRKCVYKDREKIRRTKKLKQEILIILDFLTEKSSVVGYMLRENVR